MRGMGKLLGMLNPLDQSAAQQIMKSSGGGFMNNAMALAKAGLGQVKSGAYFKGQHMVHNAQRGFHNRAMGVLGSGTTVKARTAIARQTGELRRGMAIGGAAWAGLNMMAPDSNLTKAANVGVGAAAVYGGGRMMGSKFGRGARNITWGVGGALGAGKMFGVI